MPFILAKGYLHFGTMSFYCNPCGRSFNHDMDLQQHISNSPRHAPHHCRPCNRTFSSESALNQHTRDSPAHASSVVCDACHQSFGSQDALQQHMDDQHPATPLDAFFRSFPTFAYNSTLLPNESYKKLKSHMGWHHNDVAGQEAWRGYQNALAAEVDMWFGAQDDLTAWHALCRAIGIQPLPETCAQGRQVRDGPTFPFSFSLLLYLCHFSGSALVYFHVPNMWMLIS